MPIRSISEIVAGRPFASISPDASLQDACLLMKTEVTDSLAVVENDELVGILSARDVVFRAVCEEVAATETTVRDVMTPDPRTVDAALSLAWAIEIMTENRFNHLPVIKNGRAIGMLSMRDIPANYHMMVARYSEARSGPQQYEGRVIRLH